MSCEAQLLLKDSAYGDLLLAIEAKDLVIVEKDKALDLKEQIIVGKNTEITSLRNVAEKSNKKLKWIKAGWATTSAVLGSFLIYFAIN